MSELRLVVVGGGLAALRAVETARREGHTGPLTLVCGEDRPPYDRPPLSKAVLDGTAGTGAFRSAAELRDELGVDLRLGVRAVSLDTAARRVGLDDDTGVDYDALVVATGSLPRPFPGDDLDGVRHLRTAADAEAIRDGLEAGARIVVVGAGFIGAEVASAARARGLPVTVLEGAPTPLVRSVGPDVGELVAGLHRAAGTDLRLGTGVAGLVEGEGARRGAVVGVRLEGRPEGGLEGGLEGGEVLPADLVVLGVGVAPATAWLRGSGLALHDDDGGVLCDATLAASAPGVWAAGDVAHAPHALLDGDLIRLEHWTNAAEQGAAAARHALDPGAAVALDAVPYFWSFCYGRRLQMVGTARSDEVVLLDAGPEPAAGAHGRGTRPLPAWGAVGRGAGPGRTAGRDEVPPPDRRSRFVRRRAGRSARAATPGGAVCGEVSRPGCS